MTIQLSFLFFNDFFDFFCITNYILFMIFWENWCIFKVTIIRFFCFFNNFISIHNYFLHYFLISSSFFSKSSILFLSSS